MLFSPDTTFDFTSNLNNFVMIKNLLFVLVAVNIASAQLTDPDPADDWAISQIGPNSLLTDAYTVIYAPDDYLWVTERSIGTISRFDPETGAKDQLIDIAAVYSTAGQDGLMGMVLHPELSLGTGNDYVYVAYTYDSGGDTRALRISRFTYSLAGSDGSLLNEVSLLQGLPASNDHNSGRLVIGPDLKLYYTIGDQGKNQFGNTCFEIRAQYLPSSPTDYASYQGKILRLNLDGSVPVDNPVLNGVVSHVYSYGHRNAQGLFFAGNGKLYATEHGPKSDDELNSIESGKNYGWPHIAGFNDNMAYAYCNWSTATPCDPANFSDYQCDPTVTPIPESAWVIPANYKNPVATWGTVDNSYDFQAGCGFICWPTVAPSGMRIYEHNLIPGWESSILSTTLKRGRIYRANLSADGESIVPIADPEPDSTNDNFQELWYSQNRYRDIAIAPDGITFYIITDSNGSVSPPTNDASLSILNPGIIMRVQYTGTLSVSDFNLGNNLQLVPNPATTSFSLSGKNQAADISKVKILDVNGRVVKEINAPGNREITVEDLDKGIYLINVTDANGAKASKKLIVK